MKDEREREYVEFALRCPSRKRRTYIPFVDNTIWEKVKDRVLFVFVVNAFLDRNSTHSVVDQTVCKPKTAEKYMRILKNVLFLENEVEKQTMVLGGEGKLSKLTRVACLRGNTVSVVFVKSPDKADCSVQSRISQTAAFSSK